MMKGCKYYDDETVNTYILARMSFALRALLHVVMWLQSTVLFEGNIDVVSSLIDARLRSLLRLPLLVGYRNHFKPPVHILS